MPRSPSDENSFQRSQGNSSVSSISAARGRIIRSTASAMDLRKNSCSSVNLKSITPSSPEVLPTACSDLLLRSPHRSEAPPTPDLPSPAPPHICHRYVRRASEGRTWCLHAVPGTPFQPGEAPWQPEIPFPDQSSAEASL